MHSLYLIFNIFNLSLQLLGWSSFIPNYNPRDIVKNLKRLINDEEPIPMHPWYRGFQGDIEQISKEKYKINGIIRKLNDETVRITELPIRVWTQNYKEQLEQWISGTERVTSWVQVRVYTLFMLIKIDEELKISIKLIRNIKRTIRQLPLISPLSYPKDI
jgi:DNA gyrase/topoisomerase IV subunit A